MPKLFENPGKVIVSFTFAVFVALGIGVLFLISSICVYFLLNKIGGLSDEFSFKVAMYWYLACLGLFPIIGREIMFRRKLKKIFGPNYKK